MTDYDMGECGVCGRIRINCKGHTPAEYERAERGEVVEHAPVVMTICPRDWDRKLTPEEKARTLKALEEAARCIAERDPKS